MSFGLGYQLHILSTCQLSIQRALSIHLVDSNMAAKDTLRFFVSFILTNSIVVLRWWRVYHLHLTLLVNVIGRLLVTALVVLELVFVCLVLGSIANVCRVWALLIVMNGLVHHVLILCWLIVLLSVSNHFHLILALHGHCTWWSILQILWILWILSFVHQSLTYNFLGFLLFVRDAVNINSSIVCIWVRNSSISRSILSGFHFKIIVWEINDATNSTTCLGNTLS